MAVLAASFLEDFTSTLPKKEEEDFVASAAGTESGPSSATVSEDIKKDATQDYFVSSSGSNGGTSSVLATTPEDQKTYDSYFSPDTTVTTATIKPGAITAELSKDTAPTSGSYYQAGSPVSGAQSLLDRLLLNIRSKAEEEQASVLSDLKTAAPTLATETEEYKTLEQQTKQYLGQNLQDIGGGTAVSSDLLSRTTSPTTGGIISATISSTPGTGTPIAKPTTFLDTYISQVSSAAASTSQQRLGNLIGKPVVTTSPEENIATVFRQNIGNAQAKTIASAQQAGSSALADTSKYTQPVDSSASQGSYSPPSTTSVVKPTGFTSNTSTTSAVPTVSTPAPPDVSMLGQQAQGRLENITGITAQKEAVNEQLGSFRKNISDYSSAANAQKTLENNDNISSSFNSTLDNIARSLPPEQQSNFFNELGKQLTQNISDKAENLAQLTQLGTPAQNFLKHILGYDQPQTEQNTPPDLTNKIRNYVLNDPRVQALEPGQAVNVDLEFTPGAELAAGFTFGKGVVYKDPNTGSLHFTESIDAQGKNTNQNANSQGVGTWSGKDGAYFFNKFTDPVTGKQTYDVDAAGGGLLAKFLLENTPNKAPFNVNLDLSDPSKFGAQKSYGLDDLKGIFEKALDRAKNEFDNFKEGATGVIEGVNEATSEAQRILQEYLSKIKNPWEEDPDISKKEWILTGMWDHKPRYLSTEEVMKMPDWAYGSHSIDAIRKAMSQFPAWNPGEEMMQYISKGARPPFSFSLPVVSRFARMLGTIRDGGVISQGPVEFKSYLRRNPALRGINSSNKDDFNAKEKANIAKRNALGDLFQGFMNMVQNAVKQVDWNSALSNFAQNAGRIVGY